MRASLHAQLDECIATMHTLYAQIAAAEPLIARAVEAVLAGHTLFTCGNGGSATDAIHLAEELVCRYRSNRRGLPAVCLNADVGALTCIANDFGYEQVFARQLESLARPGDVLVCFSTSGNSPNVLAALTTARAQGVTTLALLGKDGGAARTLADQCVIVATDITARIQEAHTLLLHAICEELEHAVHNETQEGA